MIDIETMDMRTIDALIHLTDAHRRSRAALQVQLDMMESGKLGSRCNGIDTTAENKARTISTIGVHDRIIAKYDPYLHL